MFLTQVLLNQHIVCEQDRVEDHGHQAQTKNHPELVRLVEVLRVTRRMPIARPQTPNVYVKKHRFHGRKQGG